MKHVFSDISHVAHLWANQLQDDARNSGNFYFDRDTIYSYGSHFPIATHVVNQDGLKGVLFTERTYSVTTSSHLSVARQACRHLNVIPCYRPDSRHDENFNFWKNKAEVQAEKLLKAKKPQIYLGGIDQIAQSARKYAEFYTLELPEYLLAVLNIGNKEQYREFAAKKADYIIAERKKEKKELTARHKNELAKWLKGETHRMYLHNGHDYLRFKDDRIETTQAVQIPIAYAKKLWENLDSLKPGDKVLEYTVNEVGADIRIGCHTFKAKYLKEFGAKIWAQ